MNRVFLTLLLAVLAGCSDKLSDEQAKEKVERYLTRIIQPGVKYIPISTKTIDTPAKYQKRWTGATFIVHRLQIVSTDGERQERADTMLIKGDTVLFVGEAR